MNNKEILKQAKQIARLGDESSYEKAQRLLLNHLKSYPKDTEAWLLVTRIECNSPLEYLDKIIEYVNQVLSYDPSNVYALLFLAYAHYYLKGEIDNNTYKKICMAKGNDPETMAMIEVAKAQYLERQDISQYEKALKKSIDYSSHQQTNYSMLGRLYLKQGKIAEGKNLIKTGLRNIKKIFNAENVNKYDSTSIEDFLNYYYKGTEVMDWMYNELESLIVI